MTADPTLPTDGRPPSPTSRPRIVPALPMVPAQASQTASARSSIDQMPFTISSNNVGATTMSRASVTTPDSVSMGTTSTTQIALNTASQSLTRPQIMSNQSSSTTKPTATVSQTAQKPHSNPATMTTSSETGQATEKPSAAKPTPRSTQADVIAPPRPRVIMPIFPLKPPPRGTPSLHPPHPPGTDEFHKFFMREAIKMVCEPLHWYPFVL
jgi:hypothetical protein